MKRSGRITRVVIIVAAVLLAYNIGRKQQAAVDDHALQVLDSLNSLAPKAQDSQPDFPLSFDSRREI